MKRPRNFNQYEKAADIAKQLRSLADHVENSSHLAKFSLSVSIWRNEWDDDDFNGGAMTSATFVNKKSGRAMGL